MYIFSCRICWRTLLRCHGNMPLDIDNDLTSESDQSFFDCCKMPSLQLLNCWTCLIIEHWKHNPHERRCFVGWSVCVCACAARSKTDKQSTLWASACPNDQIHTKYVKTAGLESIHLNTVYVLKWMRTVWRKYGFSIFCLKVTDWCFINVNQRTKRKEKITHSS